MMHTRALISTRTFGRRAVPLDASMAAPAPSVTNDLKLFGMTFFGGFLFMTVYLA